MSMKWITGALIILVVLGWGASTLLMVRIDRLNNQLQVLNMENEQLKKEISFLNKKLMENMTINIGVTAISDDDYYVTEKFFKEVVEKDINEYCNNLGYNVKFNFIVRNNRENISLVLDNLQEFKKMGIDIVIGHPWSSHTYMSMPYVEANGMLLFSPSASSAQLARGGDRLLRLCPDDLSQARVLAEALRDRGIDAIIVIQAEGEFEDDLFNRLEYEFTRRGGMSLERILIPEPLWEANITSYLDGAKVIAQRLIGSFGPKHVAVQIIGADQLCKLLKEIKKYPILYGLPWFGIHYTAKNRFFLDKAGEEAAHLGIFSPLPAPVESYSYTWLNERYHKLFSENLDFKMASRYDIAWIIARSILEARSKDVERLVEVIPMIASTTFGASGWCKLDENGDRETAD
ncbi:ABC transporter substrate-binding protein [Candidatus Bathyarchaeota archaeon]|nr:ABC transporter substrate-binding protein [Candidatus Bathyarchaeota archaeon]